MLPSILLIFAVLVYGTAAYIPQAIVFTKPDCKGTMLEWGVGYSNWNDLNNHDFDNQAYSTMVTGPWFFYDWKYFNGAEIENARLEYIFSSNNTCINLKELEGRVSSAKPLHYRQDYRLPSLTVFNYVNFENTGSEISLESPVFEFQFTISSFVITGETAWTFYNRQNYEGLSFCLQPEYTEEYQPTLVPDIIKLDPRLTYSWVKSARIGCFSENIINLPTSTRFTVTQSLRHEGKNVSPRFGYMGRGLLE